MRFFNQRDDIAMIQRKLPHWSQAGTVVFMTWRTQDSLPREVIARWREDRNRWLVLHDLNPLQPGWKAALHQLSAEVIDEFHDRFTNRWHGELDVCHGECILRLPEAARIVAESLLHFDGERYEMLDFVVMPNHVHFLATFPDRHSMLAQCKSWKQFSATQINALTGGSGRFWQQDAFDHLVRHEAQFQRLKHYIAENPVKAGLHPGEYIHRAF